MIRLTLSILASLRPLQSLQSAALTIMIMLITACQINPAKDDLFQQLGGLPGIENFVDTFIGEIGMSPQIRPYFDDTDLDRFREKQIEHICVLAGGPCTYTGDSMNDSHKGMGVTEADFNAVVDLVILAMNKQGYSVSTRNRLLARFAPMRNEVLEKPIH